MSVAVNKDLVAVVAAFDASLNAAEASVQDGLIQSFHITFDEATAHKLGAVPSQHERTSKILDLSSFPHRLRGHQRRLQ